MATLLVNLKCKWLAVVLPLFDLKSGYSWKLQYIKYHKITSFASKLWSYTKIWLADHQSHHFRFRSFFLLNKCASRLKISFDNIPSRLIMTISTQSSNCTCCLFLCSAQTSAVRASQKRSTRRSQPQWHCMALPRCRNWMWIEIHWRSNALTKFVLLFSKPFKTIQNHQQPKVLGCWFCYNLDPWTHAIWFPLPFSNPGMPTGSSGPVQLAEHREWPWLCTSRCLTGKKHKSRRFLPKSSKIDLLKCIARGPLECQWSGEKNEKGYVGCETHSECFVTWSSINKFHTNIVGTKQHCRVMDSLGPALTDFIIASFLQHLFHQQLRSLAPGKSSTCRRFSFFFQVLKLIFLIKACKDLSFCQKGRGTIRWCWTCYERKLCWKTSRFKFLATSISLVKRKAATWPDSWITYSMEVN